MTWKITKTKDPRWLAVLSDHYDEPFVADMNTIPGAYFNKPMQAWLAPVGRRAELEVVVAKHSPSPLVELKSGAEGVAQVVELALRLGPNAEVADLEDGLDLAGIRPDAVYSIEVDGRVLVVAIGRKS